MGNITWGKFNKKKGLKLVKELDDDEQKQPDPQETDKHDKEQVKTPKSNKFKRFRYGLSLK